MKELEVIHKIIEKKPNLTVSEFLEDEYIDNLVFLCYLDETYLTNENLKEILNNVDDLSEIYKYYLEDEIPYIDENEIEDEDEKIYYSALSILVSKDPKIFNKLPKEIVDNFSVNDWTIIIKNQPKFINTYKFISEMSLDNIIEILNKQPELKNNKKFLDYIDNIKDINNIAFLPELIDIYPEILNKIDKTKISNDEWVKIIINNPELINICPIKDNFNNEELVELASNNSKFIDILPEPEYIEKENLVFLINKRPELIEKFNINFDFFETYDYIEILKEHPDLIEKCDKKILSDISAEDWVDILIKQPKLEKYCNKLDEFEENNIAKLLSKRPEFIKNYNILDVDYEFNDDIFINIFNSQPILIEKINIEKIEDEDILETIIYNSKEYRIKAIKKYIKKYKDTTVLTNMIGIYPDLEKLYTEKDLWKYVNFKELTKSMEYAMLI